VQYCQNSQIRIMMNAEGDVMGERRLFGLLGPRTKQKVPISTGFTEILPPLDVEGAMRLAAVFDAVRLISEDVASLPLHVYRGTGSDRRKADDLRVYRLLHAQPNEYQSALDLREALTASLLIAGAAYAEIERTQAGEIAALHFIDPFRVQVDTSGAGIAFKVDGAAMPTDSIFHLHGFSRDGVHGVSIVSQAVDSLELSRRVDDFARSYFQNGGHVSGYLKYDGVFRNEDAWRRLLDSWNQAYKGSTRSHKTALLENGIEYRAMNTDHEKSQLLEIRRFQIEETARWFRLPPAMLGATEGTSQYKTLREQLDAYVRLSLRPWLVRWEQAVNRQLLPRAAYAEHSLDAFLRASTNDRYQAYETGLRAGFLTKDEVREKENLRRSADRQPRVSV
jgi:HK97 family phage portal protein